MVVSPSYAQLTWSKSSYPFSSSRGERADFTGDGFPDLIFFDNTGTKLIVLPNAGNGSFDSARAFSTNQQGAMALLDFNRDGKTDVALCNGKNLVILLGNGDGTLTVSQTVPVPCSSVTASDFNRDRNPDIAVTVDGSVNSGDNQVIVYLGDSSGGISDKIVNDKVNFNSTTDSGGSACFLRSFAQAADFTGDKVADIAITAPCPNGTFSNDALVVGVGDGTGHFTFHKDVEFPNDVLSLRLGDANQDNKRDLIILGVSSGPHSVTSDLFALKGNGDGTFAFQEIVTKDGTAIGAGAVADFDGDGIKDAIIAGPSDGFATPFSMSFLKGQSDGSYRLTQTSPLATAVLDLVWGDFNKDGRADLTLLRQQSTDVWLNTSAGVPTCPATFGFVTVTACIGESPSGTFHFTASPLDSFPINTIQIYIDGVLKAETPGDLLSANLQVGSGTHRITVKAWDDNGPFNASANVTPCANSANRTVKICTPTNGSTIVSTVPKQVPTFSLAATATTNLKFSEIQVYLDGVLRFRNRAKSINIEGLNIPDGTHHITVKGWDSSGAFSRAVTINVQ
jgi:hypothetical protein